MIATLVIQKKGNYRSIESLNHVIFKVCNLANFLNPFGVIIPCSSGDMDEIAVKTWDFEIFC